MLKNTSALPYNMPGAWGNSQMYWCLSKKPTPGKHVKSLGIMLFPLVRKKPTPDSCTNSANTWKNLGKTTFSQVWQKGKEVGCPRKASKPYVQPLETIGKTSFFTCLAEKKPVPRGRL